MREALFLKGVFDPVTTHEVEAIKQYIRRRHDVYVNVDGAGVLSIGQRRRLLALALRPYRHVHVGCGTDGIEITDAGQEEAVRSGFYQQAANGIRKVLVKEGMYFDEALRAHCSAHRRAHSISEADLCVELARAHGVDLRAARTAGLLHDITKSMPMEEARTILQEQEPDKLTWHPNLWHGITAYYWLRRNMGLTDRAILRAIRAHTIGEAKGKLAMILYVADKCERTRGYDAEAEIALAKKNLTQAVQRVRQEAEIYRRQKKNG